MVERVISKGHIAVRRGRLSAPAERPQVLLQPLAMESSLEVYGREGSRCHSGLLRATLKWQTSCRQHAADIAVAVVRVVLPFAVQVVVDHQLVRTSAGRGGASLQPGAAMHRGPASTGHAAAGQPFLAAPVGGGVALQAPGIGLRRQSMSPPWCADCSRRLPFAVLPLASGDSRVACKANQRVATSAVLSSERPLISSMRRIR